nr:hypothetical protein [Tanacetum cinerariifolium]
MYHDLYLGGKASVERKNVGLDLTKSDRCSSFVKDLTAKGMGLRMADSHIGNHREDDFTPLETIRRFLGIFKSRSLLSLKGMPLSRRGGYVIRKEKEADHKQLKVNKGKGKLEVDDLQNKVEKLKVDLARAIKAKQAEHDKGKGKVKKLKDIFGRMLKAKKAKEAKVVEVVQERPTTSRALTTSTSTFKASIRSKAPTVSTFNASTSALSGCRKIAMIGCLLGLKASDDPNAPPPYAPHCNTLKSEYAVEY